MNLFSMNVFTISMRVCVCVCVCVHVVCVHVVCVHVVCGVWCLPACTCNSDLK